MGGCPRCLAAFGYVARLDPGVGKGDGGVGWVVQRTLARAMHLAEIYFTGDGVGKWCRPVFFDKLDFALGAFDGGIDCGNHVSPACCKTWAIRAGLRWMPPCSSWIKRGLIAVR